jgi:predicted Zn-dependent protease
LAWIYFLQNDLKNAEKTARKGLAISPTNPWLLNILGATLMGEEKYVEAKDTLNLAKRYLKDISAQEWGEAYSGDNSKLYKQGRENMIKTIEENITKIDSITQNNIK